MSVGEYVSALLAAPKFARQVTCHRILEASEAVYAPVVRPWPKAILRTLKEAGIEALYSHQARAMDFIRAGRDVVVTTPTASGKSLVYNLPVLEHFLQDPETRALYLFPLKALAQDQRNALERLTAGWPQDARPGVALYDGDTSDHFRRKIRNNPPAVLITNPEMLHLGLLPHHERWTTFFASLSFIVLDEAHTYRGILGTHMAQLLRRLERVSLRYNARPVRILCTATVGNPAELGQSLLGGDRPPEVVAENGASRGQRHVLFMDPEESPSTLAIRLLQAALARELRTIVYCRSRRMTELISLWAADKAGPYRARISAYRAGFLPEERREIEARMASGQLLAVVSTSALELGIDIGNLDLCILVGYPGSVISMLQRGGRVGRKGQESAVVLVGGEDALDQFFIHNPEEFFRRPPEQAVLNPDNPVILARHLECAAAELPLREGEPWLNRPAVRQALHELEQRGTLLRTASGDTWLAARKRPQRDVDLRGSGAAFSIEDPDGNVIGVVDAHQAFHETHPGAVYLHRGRTYTIRELDLGAHIARAVLENVNWHTRVRTAKSTEILEQLDEGRAGRAPVAFGRLRVTERITGFERRLNGSLRLLDIQPLDLPPQIFETEGLWFNIPDECRCAVEDRLFHFMGSIHALEHVGIGLMPLLVMADRNDLGGISIPMHAQTGGPAVFIYDGLPGGAGLTRSAFPLLEDLLHNIRRTLQSCPCETGCPSCIQSPKCGSGNRPLDKAGALFLVESLLQETEPAQPAVTTCPQGVSVFTATVQADAGVKAEVDNTGDVVTSRSEIVPTAMEEVSVRSTESFVLAENCEDSGHATPARKAGILQSQDTSGPVMVFDVETRRSASEVGGWHRADRMGVSVAVVWTGQAYRSFEQDCLDDMFALLRTAGLVVGFNSFRFDYAVLQPFAGYDLHSLPGLDLLDVIRGRLGYRVSLDNLARATLDVPKSADGLQALQWWKEGNIEAIRTYCQKDVEVTKGLFEYGREHGFVLFTNKAGTKVRVPVSW